MAKIRPEEKNTPAFSGLPAGWRPRQRGQISSQIRLKTFVSLSFYRFLHPSRHLSVGPEEKTPAPFWWERREKTLAPFWPQCFPPPEEKTRSNGATQKHMIIIITSGFTRICSILVTFQTPMFAKTLDILWVFNVPGNLQVPYFPGMLIPPPQGFQRSSCHS